MLLSHSKQSEAPFSSDLAGSSSLTQIESNEDQLNVDADGDMRMVEGPSQNRGATAAGHCIRTSFDLEKESHQRDPVINEEDGYGWTEAQRSLVKEAATPSTLSELEAEVSVALSGMLVEAYSALEHSCLGCTRMVVDKQGPAMSG